MKNEDRESIKNINDEKYLEQDKKYMKLVFKLALKGVGKVNPNPLVGAIVVKNDHIVGEGYHESYGEAHAEVNALNMAGKNSENSTIYVNLEPCSHFGKTPPCVDKIIAMGVKRCVVSVLDPNPLVSGKGIEKLKNAGIEVRVGILENEGQELNRVFFHYITTGLPYVFLKCAITLDGKIATRTFDSKWITNESARKKVMTLRNRYSGIMIGINTLLQDDPSLNSREENARDPYRIIVDPELKILLDSKILKFNDKKNIIVTSLSNENSPKYMELLKLGVQFILLKNKNFLIKDILEELGKLKIDSLILEGGSNLISRVVEEGHINGGEIFIAPKILGDEKALPFMSGFKIDKMENCFQIKSPKFNIYDDNISIEFYNKIDLNI
jgi:diaminohydroxyphosphoribosylaminopyrimidine deaminase/5-amino-6-(5-phosphoribosylamino)uracil reductase